MSKHDYGGKGAVDFAKTWWLGILLEDRHHPPLSRYQRDTDRTSKLNRNRKPHQEGTQYRANEPQRPFFHLNLYRRKLDCLTYERPYTGHLKLVVNTQSEKNCVFNKHDFLIVKCFVT